MYGRQDSEPRSPGYIILLELTSIFVIAAHKCNPSRITHFESE
jgi:hypothetical protein